MRAALKYFVVGILLIAALDFTLFHVLRFSDLSRLASFSVLALVSLLLLFSVGCLMHLKIDEQRRTSYRADRGDVALLQPEGKVSPIPIDQQRRAQFASPAAEAGSASLTASPAAPSAAPENQSVPKAGTPANADEIPAFLRTPLTKRKLPMPNPPKTPHPRELAEHNKTQTDIQPVSIPDLMQSIHSEGRALKDLIEKSRERLARIDGFLMDFTQQSSRETFDAITNAQRVVSALEGRLERIRELLLTHRTPELLKAKKLLNDDLVIPTDAVNALISAKELPAIPAAGLAEAIDKLLQPLEAEQARSRKRAQNFS